MWLDDCPDMTIAVDWDVKNQPPPPPKKKNKNNNNNLITHQALEGHSIQATAGMTVIPPHDNTMQLFNNFL